MEQDSKYNLFRTNYILADFYTHADTCCYSTFGSSYISYHQSYIYICMIHIFDPLILVIMLKTLTFKSSVFLGTHTLLDRS